MREGREGREGREEGQSPAWGPTRVSGSHGVAWAAAGKPLGGHLEKRISGSASTTHVAHEPDRCSLEPVPLRPSLPLPPHPHRPTEPRLPVPRSPQSGCPTAAACPATSTAWA